MRDVTGFEAFVAARGPALLRLAWLLTADVHAAEDLAQEALARLVPRWDRLGGGGNPEAYARAAVRSIWIDSWRRRRGMEVVPLGGLSGDPGERSWFPGGGTGGVEEVPVRLGLAEALRRLAPRQRAVLVLRFYEDLTEVETARALGCSPSTVKSQCRDGLARLRTLAPWLGEDLGTGSGRELTR
ncbi:MAG: SigE family RNA polymerase sigma factor [Actinomycetales bacterium]|nr:SigE family RNA polymerase sigma factor [Actinomycetales bacterium]